MKYRKALAVVLSLSTWGLSSLRADTIVAVPLHFGVQQALLDELGAMLPGTANEPGAVVQILLAPNGIFPPRPDGQPSTNNPVLGTFHIGQGVDPAAGPLGRVAGSVMINRYQPNAMFARVYNRSAIEDATFYTDSLLYTNSTTTYGIFYIQATQTTNELFPVDDDGDGLSESWERSIGTDALSPDTDDDGVNDGDEILAGTNPLDGADVLQMVELQPQAGGLMKVLWDSVPGKSYQLQYTTGSLAEANPFIDLNPPVVATGAASFTIITNVPDNTSFRVKLLVTP